MKWIGWGEDSGLCTLVTDKNAEICFVAFKAEDQEWRFYVYNWFGQNEKGIDGYQNLGPLRTLPFNEESVKKIKAFAEFFVRMHGLGD